MPPFRAVAAANSGAMFGRKFSSSTDEGRDGIRWIESYLADSSRVRLSFHDVAQEKERLSILYKIISIEKANRKCRRGC